MRILELCHFSSGSCGVWQRVKKEAISFSNEGHLVKVFSSNKVKGKDKLADKTDFIEDVEIKRFSAKHWGGESFMSWDFEKVALEFKPNIIIAHGYRHLHTTRALETRDKLMKQGYDCKVFLVGHSLFPTGNTRSIIAKIIVNSYDRFDWIKRLNDFDGIIAIAEKTKDDFIKLGADEDKIIYSPNWIDNKFKIFQRTVEEKPDKILFFGRISPIKDIETLIKATYLLKDNNFTLEIVGPNEGNYLNKLRDLVKEKNLEDKINFLGEVDSDDLDQKISIIDSAKIFVLPSKSEGMPQALMEAMSRGKIVISSNNPGSKGLIQDGKNGFLFNIGDEKELAEKIDFALQNDFNEIRNNARNHIINEFLNPISTQDLVKQPLLL